MPAASSPSAGAVGRISHHGGAEVRSHDPLHVVTPAAQWSYATSWTLHPSLGTPDGALHADTRFVIDLDVLHGQVGVGWTNAAGDAFVIEKVAAGPGARVSLLVTAGTKVGRLIIRNAWDARASEFVVHGITAWPQANAIRFPVSVQPRDLAAEVRPESGDTATFDTDAALAINAARIGWLEAANLPVQGARVLDVGAGVGRFIPHYKHRGCTVVAVDGRAENIVELERRHPDVAAHVADIQTVDPKALGTFDVIHCFGLLYHLDSPLAALRNLHAMCDRFLVLETMVCDAREPVMVLADETKTFSQALAGLGSRPSPSFVAMALNRVGFPYVYGASPVPRHEDFDFEFKGNLDVVRDGHALRCVFVASREVMDSPMLVPLIE
jgi:2-polyprenyl-3-methyl-5-hydroxy-6-metoxy-1,4-benzoquinol methylase